MLGLCSAAFFAVTFVLNRNMATANGHWAWSSSLRFFLMLPLLAIVLTMRGQWPALRAVWQSSPWGWILWGTVGFGIFYATLTTAAAYAPAWVVAGTWPVTIVAGLLLAPLLYQDARRYVPRKAVLNSLAILGGVFLLQAGQIQGGSFSSVLIGLILVLISAVAYPLGGRKSMLLVERSGAKADSFVRLTALTLGSLPAWLIVAGYGYTAAGWPQPAQILQCGIIALCSGVIATFLLFAAMDAVRKTPSGMAAVEATQAAETVFTLVLEALLLGIHWPGTLGLTGLAIILIGIIRYARISTPE